MSVLLMVSKDELVWAECTYPIATIIPDAASWTSSIYRRMAVGSRIMRSADAQAACIRMKIHLREFGCLD